jgi:hypothetical protein
MKILCLIVAGAIAVTAACIVVPLVLIMAIGWFNGDSE